MSWFAVSRCRFAACWLVIVSVAAATVGCDRPEPIATYVIPTVAPAELRPEQSRMLAAMLPRGNDVWIFKVTGPDRAITGITTTFRNFIRDTQFNAGVPRLDPLPDQWRLGGKKPIRFASIDIETPDRQLDVSISKFERQADWDEQVKMNVNRWRGQLGLPPSDSPWAAAAELEIGAADATGVWVDLLGEASAVASMAPPFAGGGLPADHPTVAPGAAAEDGSAPAQRLRFDRPDGWRDGELSSMRMAAFNVGPEEAAAELTVISAGGDVRGNVARWLGQVRNGTVPDEVVDQALADADPVQVDGRAGQRFYLAGEDSTAGTAIDATIVPIDGGMSLFIKMTGPTDTVIQQSAAIESFLQSLELNL